MIYLKKVVLKWYFLKHFWKDTSKQLGFEGYLQNDITEKMSLQRYF